MNLRRSLLRGQEDRLLAAGSREMGIFCTWKDYQNDPLTGACCKAIEQVLEKDADVLFP